MWQFRHYSVHLAQRQLQQLCLCFLETIRPSTVLGPRATKKKYVILKTPLFKVIPLTIEEPSTSKATFCLLLPSLPTPCSSLRHIELPPHLQLLFHFPLYDKHHKYCSLYIVSLLLFFFVFFLTILTYSSVNRPPSFSYFTLIFPQLDHIEGRLKVRVQPRKTVLE